METSMTRKDALKECMSYCRSPGCNARVGGSRLSTYGANVRVSEEDFRHTARASSYANAITVRPLRPDLG